MSQYNDGQEYNDDELHSKSELKREMDELQAYGTQLMDLKDAELQRLPMTEILWRAIRESRRISAHEARRRHAQYVGKIMRDEHNRPVVAALLELKNPARQRWILDWQTRLAEAADNNQLNTLTEEMMARYPHGDRQHLRNLCRNVLQVKPPAEDASKETLEKFRRERRKVSDYVNGLEKTAPLY